MTRRDWDLLDLRSCSGEDRSRGAVVFTDIVVTVATLPPLCWAPLGSVVDVNASPQPLRTAMSRVFLPIFWVGN